MTSFLDRTGLAHFWEKIAAKLGLKADASSVYTKAQVDDMIEDVAYFGDTVGNVTTADFNAQTDTVWNKTQVLSSAQQAQARANIGAQETLVSGTNIKTINNESILGSGNITISGGGGGDTNVIEAVKVNGTALTPDANKAVDVTVPTESTVTGWGFTKNTGNVNSVTVNGTTYNPTNGDVNLGTISGGGGEANVIESISINGTAQTVTSKNVDLAVPTSSTITAIVTLTEAQYTALSTKDSSTLYIITA